MTSVPRTNKGTSNLRDQSATLNSQRVYCSTHALALKTWLLKQPFRVLGSDHALLGERVVQAFSTNFLDLLGAKDEHVIVVDLGYVEEWEQSFDARG